MGAADEIREGIRQKYLAMEEAGLYNHQFEMMLLVSSENAAHIVGNQGEKRYYRFTIKPNPQIDFRRVEVFNDAGWQKKHDVTIKGAFPETVQGSEQLIVGGEITSTVPASKTYISPRQFRDDIEKAEAFFINGERYKYRGDGSLQIDNKETEWTLRLVRANKQ